MGAWRPLTDAECEDIVQLAAEGVAQIEIGRRIGRSQSAVRRVLLRRDLLPGNPRSGAAHGWWKGGRFKSNRYWRVKVDASDPMASMRDCHGYVLEHRLVVARKIGRPLRPNETVHHINGDSSDNRPENLQLRQGRHGKHVAYRCLDCGSHNVTSAPLEGELSR